MLSTCMHLASAAGRARASVRSSNSSAVGEGKFQWGGRAVGHDKQTVDGGEPLEACVAHLTNPDGNQSSSALIRAHQPDQSGRQSELISGNQSSSA